MIFFFSDVVDCLCFVRLLVLCKPCNVSCGVYREKVPAHAPLSGVSLALCKPIGHIQIFSSPVPRFFEKTGHTANFLCHMPRQSKKTGQTSGFLMKQYYFSSESRCFNPFLRHPLSMSSTPRANTNRNIPSICDTAISVLPILSWSVRIPSTKKRMIP